MPNKEITTKQQQVVPTKTMRPQRNVKTKVVFDPSDLHVPKNRNKASKKCEKDSETSKKRSVNENKHTTTELVNAATKNQSIERLLIEPVSLSYDLFQSDSEDSCVPPELFQDDLTLCCLCKDGTLDGERECINCPICTIKVHSDCLMVNEPMWRFKLAQLPWFCKECRGKYCSLCCSVESQMNQFYRCIMCNISLHADCYESLKVKPFHILKSDSYVCIPCMRLATKKIPLIESEDESDTHSMDGSTLSTLDNNDKNIASVYPYWLSTVSHINTDCDKTDSHKTDSQDDCAIPDVTDWDKFKVFDYFTMRGLPQTVTEKIINNEIDGHAILLFQREDITKYMDLKLGHALKFYKEVRVLQTKCRSDSLCWG